MERMYDENGMSKSNIYKSERELPDINVPIPNINVPMPNINIKKPVGECKTNLDVRIGICKNVIDENLRVEFQKKIEALATIISEDDIVVLLNVLLVLDQNTSFDKVNQIMQDASLSAGTYFIFGEIIKKYSRVGKEFVEFMKDEEKQKNDFAGKSI